MKQLNADGHQVSVLNGNILEFEVLKEQTSNFLNKKLADESSNVIVHLAGLSSPPKCESSPADAFRVNTLGTSFLLESIRQSGQKNNLPHFIFASTAHVYDMPTDDSAITESTPIKIKNVYSETKLQAEDILNGFSIRNQMRVTILRLFNHAHISQSRDFLIPSIYHQIKELGTTDKIVKVGNLDLYRDIGTIPDLMTAFQTVVSSNSYKSNFDIFNVCSGKAYHLMDIAKNIAIHLKRTDVQFVVESNRVRANEIKKVVGSYEKMKSIFGWTPKNREFKNFFVDLESI